MTKNKKKSSNSLYQDFLLKSTSCTYLTPFFIGLTKCFFSLFKRDHKIHISTFHIQCKDDKHTIKNVKLVRISRKMVGAHLADGLPLTLQMQQCWGCNFHFLKVFTHMNIKGASKKFFIVWFQNYQLHCLANSAHQG